MIDAIIVTATSGAKEEAISIAQSLVEKHLGACVQVQGPITSCYRWKGNVETSQEWLCTIKTVKEAYPRVEQAIREIHSYDEPEIVATPIVDGSESYLQWLREQVSV